MNRFLFSVFIIFVSAGVSFAQVVSDSTHLPAADSPVQKDTTAAGDSTSFLNTGNSDAVMQAEDSLERMPKGDTGWTISPALPYFPQQLSWELLKRHPYFGFSAMPLSVGSERRQITGKEPMFYLLVYLLLLLAFMRGTFPKYFNDLFRLFFRNTLKQRQISEQLMESPVPSLLLNVFFVITGGLYITFLLQFYKLNPVESFWLMYLYCVAGLTGIYTIKFLALRISGWLFHIREVANSYIFIVFIINKMIGVLLLPFLILLAFTSGDIYAVALTLSWSVVAGLLIYRIILTFGVVRNQVKVNPFHFFLYISAFEIAPLLLIYKALLLFFRITA